MNITQQVRELFRNHDDRIKGRIGSDSLFTNRCDDCGDHATVLTETITEHARGAEREGGIYCLYCAIGAIDWLSCGDADQITVTVPASLLVSVSILTTDLAA
ncbi:hypothetical protein [Nocardia niwae]|uniref:hypothetical protein n=1 Tax=Nocardia niwae TaxID=626084 RepID=UPI0007A4F78E|nr:hypothetical protein [Nocardia niwae]